MRGDFDIPGFAVEGLIGAGPTGEVWLATEESSREKVAVKRLRLDPVDGPDALRRLVATLQALDHEHLLRIRSIAGGDDQPALVTDHAESGSLGQLLRARGHLDPGEVVTIVGPTAEALAAVHGRGLVHGAVTPENILFTEDGRPLLSDTALNQITAGDEGSGGTHGFTDPRASSSGRPSAAADVFGLAAVAWAALTGTAPPAAARPSLLAVNPGVPPGLAHAIESGLQPEPDVRPDANQLADMVYAAAAPAPVRFPVGLVLNEGASGEAIADVLSGTPGVGAAAAAAGSPTVEAPPEQDRPADQVPGSDDEERVPGSVKRPLLLGLIGGGVLVLASAVVLGLWLSGRDGGHVQPIARSTVSAPTTTPQATPTPRLPAQPDQKAGDWSGTIAGLVDLRARAFRRADPALIDMIFIAGSPAAKADASLIAGLQQRDQHAERYRLLVKSASVASQSATEVRLHAVTQQPAYVVVSDDGERQRSSAKAPLDADIVLRKAADGYWRIYNW